MGASVNIYFLLVSKVIYKRNKNIKLKWIEIVCVNIKENNLCLLLRVANKKCRYL